MNNEQFTEIVVATIKKRGLRYDYVASRAGMSKQSLSNKIHGGSKWSVDQVMSVSKVLGIPSSIWD